MRRRSVLPAVVLLACAAGLARAGGDADPPAGKASPKEAARAAEVSKGPQIQWATYFQDAMDEAAERNVPIFLHSHESVFNANHGGAASKAILRAVFHDPEYVRWANEVAVHVIAYSIDPKAKEPEPTIEVERDGKKVAVLAAYPAFTASDMEFLRAEIEKRVKYPVRTPWAGVLSPDAKQVLAEVERGTPNEFRAAYESAQKKLGAPLDRARWRKIRASLRASMDAEADLAWKKAVASALEAKAAAKDVPKALSEAVEARISSLAAAGRARLADARKSKDPATALAQVRDDFAGLALDDAPK